MQYQAIMSQTRYFNDPLLLSSEEMMKICTVSTVIIIILLITGMRDMVKVVNTLRQQ